MCATVRISKHERDCLRPSPWWGLQTTQSRRRAPDHFRFAVNLKTERRTCPCADAESFGASVRARNKKPAFAKASAFAAHAAIADEDGE